MSQLLIVLVFMVGIAVYFSYYYGYPETYGVKDMTVSQTHISHQDQLNGIEEMIVSQSNTSHQDHQNGTGYMFSLDFVDQGTGSFHNFMSLLCFASEIGGVRVVEPFMYRSVLGLYLKANWTSTLRFSEIFDIHSAEEFAEHHHYTSKIAPFEEFLQKAPRKLLVADHKCSTCRKGCGYPDNGRIFAEQHGFELVGSICLDYDQSGKTPIRDIERQIYHNYSKSELTVMFNIFGGMERGKYNPQHVYRFNIALRHDCYRSYDVNSLLAIKPGPLVIQSADRYTEMYLEDKKYISVMIRLQFVLNQKVDAKDARNKTVKCFENISGKLSEIKMKYGIDKVFLCLDIGKYGSDVLRSKRLRNRLGPVCDSFLSQSLRIGMTLSEYDETFTNTTLRDNPGFVAMMQKAIAVEGEVLVLVGGGSNYHRSTHILYKKMHKNRKVIQLSKSCK